MRLKQIKLAGFKSFVDPTTVPFPSNLVGIVGPNGCGKSNIVDAIRWVMGEISAKQLRGASMEDVIFNGSSARKPVSHASVELCFDNSDGSLGGEYARYSEIVIKRQVTRDGQSSYFLNSTRCRRKDILEIFLGTGLGSRSYAVIEQGMISRFIEAKPDDLRIYLEEAAGISKYKERRRETETRLQHTSENLERLKDLREEVGKQLEKLRYQAKAAERYKLYKEEERQLQAQCLTLHVLEMTTQFQTLGGALRECEIKLEAENAEHRRIGADIEKSREQHVEATDTFNTIQGRYYALGADIARLEENIHHQRARRQQLIVDQAQLEETWKELSAHLEQDAARINSLNLALETEEPLLNDESATELALRDVLANAEKTMNEWQMQWDVFNQEAADAVQRARVEQTGIQHLEQQIQQRQHQLQRAEKEMADIRIEPFQTEITELSKKEVELSAQIQTQQTHIRQLSEQLQHKRDTYNALDLRIQELRQQIQTAKARESSLRLLQQASLGKGDHSASAWLSRKQLQDRDRLAKHLSIDSGWELAVQTVLGDTLEAICVPDFNMIDDDFTSVHQGQFTLFVAHDQVIHVDQPDDALSLHVHSSVSLGDILKGIRCAPDVATALAMRSQLAEYESVITPTGLWLGKNWLRVSRASQTPQNALEREKELSELQIQLTKNEEDFSKELLTQNVLKEALQALEHQRELSHTLLNELSEQRAKISAQRQIKQNTLERSEQRKQQLYQEVSEHQQHIAQAKHSVEAARQAWQEALQDIEKNENRKQQLSHTRTSLRDALDQAREKARAAKEIVHQLTLKVQQARTQSQSILDNQARIQTQLRQLSVRRDELSAALAEGDSPIQQFESELTLLLEKRFAEEHHLKNARQELETIQTHLQKLEQERDLVIGRVEVFRGEIEQKKIALQTFEVRRDTYLEQLQALDFDFEVVKNALPAGANLLGWQEQVEAVASKIQRLGAINLAAIEECTAEEERKRYLDSQFSDLTEALTTLENAIHKIDRETKDKFKETFEAVNQQFQTLFPRVFGGGSASLELTENDLLNTGVNVIARPPGKRNTSIHLLSGGEKALTAIALVFSIFSLNPAPFCLLDEVDAPLDDSNVNRFCQMVREMSEKVQFIFISHNKGAIEMADHLAGVTMQEPGVSRLVSVDVEEAVKLAEV